MASQEAFTLDSLALNDGTTFGVDEVSWPPPAQRADWIGAADSEAQLLFRNPLHQNRVVTLRVGVLPQADMNTALGKIALVVDKLAKASQTTDGIALVWTPATGSLSCTFDVLAGEVTDLPIDWASGWLAYAPTFTITLTCKPYWRGTETLTSTNSSSTPFNAFEIASVTGDIPALGRLIVTDTATQSRRHIEWGLEGPLTYNNATSLLVDSDDMVTSGFSGTQTTATGAYDPNASGNSTITLSPVAGATTAMAGVGNLSHVGVFRVKARVQSGSLSNLFRLSWKAADGPTNYNTWASPISTANWQELDLGTITIPAVTLGTQRWTGQVEVQGDTASPGTVLLDYLILVPQTNGYGKARAIATTGVGTLAGLDSFIGTTAGSALNTRTAPLGGAWATSGDATDFAFADSFIVTDSVESAARSTSVVETNGRTAILGSTSYTDTQIDVRVSIRETSTIATHAEWSLLARYVDSSNYLRFVSQANEFSGSGTLKLEKVIAGTVTTLASTTSGLLSNQVVWRKRLIVYATGHAIAQAFTSAGVLLAQLEAIDSTLATSGTLQTGKPGIRDRSGDAITAGRAFTDFTVTVPPLEAIALYSGKSMQIRYDDTVRQDSTGTYYGRPQSYKGSRFLVPVGTSRVLVKARRNDIEVAVDDQVTDALQIQVGWTPRGLVVPR